LRTKGFLAALKFNFKDKLETYKYMDLQDGSTYKKNNDEMEENFNQKFSSVANDRRPIMINLLLGQFFDGSQLYKKKQIVFWPLQYIILNLLPSFRIKLVNGMFNILIFTSKLKSNAEDFY
jgi:hypothetical protein